MPDFNGKFTIYEHILVINDFERVTRQFIVIKDEYGILHFTDFHKYCVNPKRRITRFTQSGNTRCKFIAAFLNYVFQYRELDKLSNLTSEMVKEYLTLYGKCELPDDDMGTHRSKATVERCAAYIFDFCEMLSRDLGPRKDLLVNPTPGKLIEAISKIDAYYKKVADYGADLYQAYQKIKAERNTLRKRVKELEEALELANGLLKEEKTTHKTCAAELAAYKGVFEKYTYPDISNEILKKAGVIKGDTDSTVDTEAVKNDLITKDCDILSFSNNKDEEATDTDTAPDTEALDVPEELVSESTVINMLSKRMFE